MIVLSAWEDVEACKERRENGVMSICLDRAKCGGLLLICSFSYVSCATGGKAYGADHEPRAI